jgi:hypothetical protein
MPQFTIDHQAAMETCQHCRSVYSVSRGSVYEDSQPFALYIAGMHDCNGHPVVVLAIAVARPDGEVSSAMTLQVQPSETEYEIRILEPDNSPWKSHSYLGHMLTRNEVLKSPLRETFYQIADTVITSNVVVHTFLNTQ